MNQEDQLMCLYGRVAFHAHLIEDLVLQHLHDCNRSEKNCELKLEKVLGRNGNAKARLKKLGRIYAGDREWERLITQLDGLREIRNLIIHSMITQVGNDFRTQEGVDQIMALLERVLALQVIHLESLRKKHHQMFTRQIPAHWLLAEDRPRGRSVSASDIQSALEKLERGCEADDHSTL